MDEITDQERPFRLCSRLFGFLQEVQRKTGADLLDQFPIIIVAYEFHGMLVQQKHFINRQHGESHADRQPKYATPTSVGLGDYETKNTGDLQQSSRKVFDG